MRNEKISEMWDRLTSSNLDKVSKVKKMNNFRKHLACKHGIKLKKSSFYDNSFRVE
jgi:hypothetical protein